LSEPMTPWTVESMEPDATRDRYEADFLAAVDKGKAAAERGEFIEEEEMDARVEAMFKASLLSARFRAIN